MPIASHLQICLSYLDLQRLAMSPLPFKLQSTLYVCGLLTIWTLGCGGVRENRTIEFSRDGTTVAFQNGNDGVFVANSTGEGLTKIFQPDDSVLATSRPLASPVDGRLIFATAEPLEGESVQPQVNRPVPAEGRIAWLQPVRYTCWLRTEPHNDQAAEVKKLFEARCGHLGYVSAGLAVRWNPTGTHVFYCAQLVDHASQHSVFAFEIASGKSERVFPIAAAAVICDWTPAGSRLVCVAGDGINANTGQTQTGIWIGHPFDDKSWWRVADSERIAQGTLPSLLEQLRATRPAWTRDDSQFAFVSQSATNDTTKQSTHRLHRGVLANHETKVLTEASGPITDLHWSPDGTRLGYVEHISTKQSEHVSAERSVLKVVDGTENSIQLPTEESIRRFAGFDATGQQIAYVVGQTGFHSRSDDGTLLLRVNDQPDCVRLAPANATGPGREIFSGMQVTFPAWSPTEERLSLWLTFVPRYRSLLSLFAQIGMWPGDPAVTIDVKTGALSWMPVTPQEELQVGNYYLLKGDPEEAWRWYQKARPKLPPAKSPRNWQDFTQTVGAPENSQLFEYICLKRLGRDDEAAAKWNEFQTHFYPSGDAAGTEEPVPNPTAGVALNADADPVMRALIRDLLIAEVFLSVDGLNEAIAQFRQPPPAEEADAIAFSRTVVLAQLLLIANQDSDYLILCTESIAPLALKLWQDEQPGQQPRPTNATIQTFAGLSLAPLFRSDFIEQLPRELIEQQLRIWKQFSAERNSGIPAVAIDLVLRSFSRRLNNVAEAEQAEQRLVANPSAQQLFAGQPIDEWVRDLFAFSAPNLSTN